MRTDLFLVYYTIQEDFEEVWQKFLIVTVEPLFLHTFTRKSYGNVQEHPLDPVQERKWLRRVTGCTLGGKASESQAMSGPYPKQETYL